MEIEYEELDKILNYLNKVQGYRGWQAYQVYSDRNKTIKSNSANLDGVFAGRCYSLLHWGLVYYKYDGNDKHTFIINPKGIDLVNSKKSTRQLHEEFKRREKLEDSILLGTIDSHKIGKRATNLNIIQLIVTVILGIVTYFSLNYQNHANNISSQSLEIARQSLEIAEQAHQLEVDNKKTIDSVVVIMSSQNQIKK